MYPILTGQKPPKVTLDTHLSHLLWQITLHDTKMSSQVDIMEAKRPEK